MPWGQHVRFWFLIVVASVSLAGQTYSVEMLPLSADMPEGSGYRIWAFNNRYQALGEQDTPGAAQRYPTVWTAGVPAKLPIPAGYGYWAEDDQWQISDGGEVVGQVVPTGAPNPNFGGRIAVFTKAGGSSWTGTLLPHGPTGATCSPAVGDSPFGLNKAGHIAGYSYDASVCNAWWIWDGANFNVLPQVPPLALPPGCTQGLGAPYIELYGARPLNDADELVGEVDVDWYCPIFTASVAFVYKQGAGYTYLSTPAGIGSTYADTRNDKGQTLGYGSSSQGGTESFLWSGATVSDLGISGTGLNDLGQLLQRSETTGALEIWRNGQVTAVTLPAGLDTSATFIGINDAGQIAGNAQTGPFIMTPRRGCAADETSQVGLVESAFYLSPNTGRYIQKIVITNNGSSVLSSPLSIVFDALPSNVSVFGINGTTLCGKVGSPYISAAVALEPGTSTSIVAQFIDESGSPITYTDRVIAGAGGR